MREFADRRVGRSSRSGSTTSSQPQPDLEPGRGAGPGLHRRGVRRLRARRCRSGEQLCQQHCPVSHVAHEFPQLCEAETEAIGRVLGRHVQRLATIAHGDGVCTTCIPTRSTRAHRRRRRRSPHDLHRRAQPRAQGHRPLRVRLGRHRRRRRDRQARPQRGRRPRHLREEERAAVDARPAPEGPQALPPQADADLGLATFDGIDFDNIKYFVRSTEKQAATWEDLPEDIKNTYDKLGIPEAEKQRLVSGVAAQYESEVVYHQIREDLEEQGVLFLDTDTALQASTPELFQEYFGTVIPVGDNKFAALNTSVWSGGSFIYVPQGRARRHPAAGLLPDQHREHGPVRADPDHRRRGRLRALRRGLHRADLLLRLAALRGRRDHREEGRPLPLHDHPELVEQRLQPGHQARDLRGRRDHGVGRRQHRLQGDDEVPRRLPDGRARQGRDAVDRVRGRGPAPGRRRQDGARRAAHLALDPVASRWRAAVAARRTAA